MAERPSEVFFSGSSRLYLNWNGECYSHCVSSGRQLFESADRRSEFESPAYTDLHRQDCVLFLSGATRGGHWSASIEPIEGGFEFDVALRATAKVGEVMSAYVGSGFSLASTTGSIETRAIDSRQNLWLVRPVVPPEGPPYTLRYRYSITPAP